MCASQLSRSALRCGGISTRRKSESVALKANGRGGRKSFSRPKPRAATTTPACHRTIGGLAPPVAPPIKANAPPKASRAE
ncbi:unnamed protein product [Lampetra planeri]